MGVSRDLGVEPASFQALTDMTASAHEEHARADRVRAAKRQNSR